MSAVKNMSLFIPHVFPNFDQQYIAESFAEIGDVERVDLVAKLGRDGKTHNAVYIHFKKWYDNKTIWFASGIVSTILTAKLIVEVVK